MDRKQERFLLCTNTTPILTFQGKGRRRMEGKPQMSLSHVFTSPLLLPLMSCLLFLIQPGSGLHPPQCQWDVYQNIERLKCLVNPGNNLIVEEEVNGIGPENAKSLSVLCSDNFHTTSSVNSQAELEVDSYFGSEKTNLRLSPGAQGGGGEVGEGFVLSKGAFMSVANLRALSLENCKIQGITPGAFTYLPFLQNLTIRAQTSLLHSAGAAAPTLTLKSLSDLSELKYLDLSTTLAMLPTDFLCQLNSLTYLNLTRVGLKDVRDIGIVPSRSLSDPNSNCGNHIKVLDISANHFSLLPPATFSTISKLEELRIDHNSITSASERALLGLNQLKIFSIAGNQLSSLQPDFFSSSRQLEEIMLQNNNLQVLAPGLFSNLEQLLILQLNHNRLTSEWVTGDIFKGLVRLIVLNLSNNQLTRVDNVLFRDLYSLQVLNLENNDLQSVSQEAFSGMYNLHTLLLSHNNLKTIDNFICNGLSVLSFLALDNNKIESVSKASFNNCSNLLDLNLSGNKLTTVPEAIAPLNLLRTLDLGENKIVDIRNASYQSLPNLYGLRLTDNSIRHVPKDAFVNLASLKIVNLAKNNITTIETGTWDNNLNLQAIRLDSNHISDISGLFNNIKNLLWLNMSSNELIHLNYEDTPKSIQWLDLRSNKIATVGTCLESSRIRNLDLSHNLISEIRSDNIPDRVEKLVISFNRIHHIQDFVFYRKQNLTRVGLNNNNLSLLNQNSLRLSPSRVNSNGQEGVGGKVEIFLGNNPLQCDCGMEWLQSLQSGGDSSGQYPIIQDVEDVKCTLSFRGSKEPLSFLKIENFQFLCKYESQEICPPLCQCCEFEHCDCKITCPKNCSCYHNQEWTKNVVQCSMMEQTLGPGALRALPIGVTDAFLDGNVFPSLDSHSFIGRKNLRSLYLNNSAIEVIQNRTFYKLSQLKELHLEDNYLERLEGFEFEDLEELEELYLHKNSISFISNLTFTTMTSLRVLTLHGNNLVDVAIWQVVTHRIMMELADITLGGNEWSCECEFATHMKEWLIENRAKISDSSQVHCVDQVSTSSSLSSSSSAKSGSALVPITSSNGHRSELIVVRLLDQRNHRCSQTTDLSIREPTASSSEEFEWSPYVPIVACLIGFLLLIGLISILCYYWRKALKVWFYANCGLRLEGSCREPYGERDKLFDAFVSYSSKDEAWVRQVFAAELERNDPPYRLCLRYRDLPTGGTYLADTIVQAAEASRRTILVLSHHFLKGEWSRTDVKSAHLSVLKDRHRVIVIVLGELPTKELDADIRLYLKNHTYLNCDEKNFWAKLKYAMPEVKVNKGPFRGSNGRSSAHYNGQQQNQRGMPPPPPPHYQCPLPQPPTQQQYHQPSPSLTSSHHHLLNSVNNVSANNSANNTLHHHQQHHNLMNALSGVILPNGMNHNSMMAHHMPPNILPLVNTGGGGGSGPGSLRQSSQQRQYHTIVNSTLNGGVNGGGNPNNRHTAVHI